MSETSVDKVKIRSYNSLLRRFGGKSGVQFLIDVEIGKTNGDFSMFGSDGFEWELI